MLAVTRILTYRVVVGLKVIDVDCPFAVLKGYAWDAVRSVKVVPLVLPWTLSVWLRPPHPSGGRSTTRSMLRLEPRSAWSHWGKALLVLSQYVALSPSLALAVP